MNNSRYKVILIFLNKIIKAIQKLSINKHYPRQSRKNHKMFIVKFQEITSNNKILRIMMYYLSR